MIDRIGVGIGLIELGIGLIELGIGLIELGIDLMELRIRQRINNARRPQSSVSFGAYFDPNSAK